MDVVFKDTFFTIHELQQLQQKAGIHNKRQIFSKSSHLCEIDFLVIILTRLVAFKKLCHHQ